MSIDKQFERNNFPSFTISEYPGTRAHEYFDQGGLHTISIRNIQIRILANTPMEYPKFMAYPRVRS